MPHSTNRLYTSRPPGAAFDFISDFRHAALWDPNTQRSEMLTPGPIGPGSRFLLSAKFLGLPMALPYQIEIHERPHRLVVAGATWYMRYREQVDFSPEGTGTRIVYNGDLTLTGLLALGNPLMALLYQRIGDSATSGIVTALERAVPADAQGA